MYVYLTAVFVS